jgi:serine protease Do
MLLSLFVVLSLASSPSPDDVVSAQEAFQQELFERVAPTVVFISTGSGFGSGFAVSDSLILTNRHVVEKAKDSAVKVVLRSGRVLNGKVVELGEGDVDVALVQVKEPELPVASFLQNPNIRVGSWVAAVGHGEGSVWTFNTGMVSNVYANNSQRRVFQTQIPVNPGNSGGPIVDRQGRAVGIVTAGIAGANSINFGIDLSVAFQALPRLRSSSRTLTLYGPPGVPLFLNGKSAGIGPSVSVPALTAPAEAFAVVNGVMVRQPVAVDQREVYLGVSPDAGSPAAPPSAGPKRRPLTGQ